MGGVGRNTARQKERGEPIGRLGEEECTGKKGRLSEQFEQTE